MNTEVTSQLHKLLDDFSQDINCMNLNVKNLLDYVSENDFSTTKGISFLEVKNHLLLNYLLDLSLVIGTKLNGESIKNSPSIARLVEIRTVLEKMRPIDQKLKYQVDKLVKTASTGISENDPLRYKPQPHNLISKFEDVDENELDDSLGGEKSSKVGVYKPPKLSAAYFDDMGRTEKIDKQKEKAVKRALSSSIMKELKQDYYQGPEEIQDTSGHHRLHTEKEFKEKRDYEEKYFVRMPVTKKDKAKARKSASHGGINDITHFSSISALDGEFNNEKGKKRKLGKKSANKGKKGSKKRKYK